MHGNDLKEIKRRNILHIGNYNPFEVDGGIERFTLNVCQILSKRSDINKVTLVCSSLKNSNVVEEDKLRIVNLYCRFKIFELPIPSLNALRILKNEIKNADIIHVHYPNPFSAFIASLLIKRYNKKSVLSIHTHIGIDDSGEKRGVLYKPLAHINNNLLLPYLLSNTGKILIPSPEFLDKSNFTSHYRHKSEIIPNGVDTLRFNPAISRDTIKNKFNLSGNVILFVSSLNSSHKGKGLPILMEAFKKVKQDISDAKLLIVGDGDMKIYYQDYSKKLGIEKDILFLGRIPNNELPHYYASADVFVLPSTWYESFGIVLAEAMACGVPAIGSNIGGIPYVIGDRDLLVEPGNVDSLHKALIKILGDKMYAKQKGMECRKRVEKYFTWYNTADLINNIYNTVA